MSINFPEGKEGEESGSGQIEELDMEPMEESMDEQKAQDLADIGRLQKHVALLASRITIRDITVLSAIGRSHHGDQDFSREFKKLSDRPTILSNRSQKRQINEVQHDIEAQEEEIELLKKKLQFKTVLEHH